MKKSISARFPVLLPFCYQVKVILRKIDNRKNKIRRLNSDNNELKIKICEHQSPLRRKASIYTEELLQAKRINLSIAIKTVDKIVIKPGDVFSFWTHIGKPTFKRGFKKGLMLKNGKPIDGPGGGLCQLSNFLFWMFLHTEMEIVERHHHSFDSFPDDGRTLPFGSGASVLYNYYDLMIMNNTNRSYQIKVWLTDTKLRGKVLSDEKQEKISVLERNHKFVISGEKIFRSNEIYKQKGTEDELVCKNFVPVLYAIDREKLSKDGILVEEITLT